MTRLKILFVATTNALPARDGVTIPVAGYIDQFKADHDIDYLYLKCEGASDEGLNRTRQAVRNHATLRLKRDSKIRAILAEFLGRRPYYGSHVSVDLLPDWAQNESYDIVFAGTAPAIGAWQRNLWDLQIQHKKKVAMISDMHSLVIHNQALNAVKSQSLKYKYINRTVMNLRCACLCKSEYTMLEQYDHVLVQTEKELLWASQIGGRTFTDDRFVIAPNGVNNSLFTLPASRVGRSIVFIGGLCSVYRQRLDWLIENVWRKLHELDPSITFTVVGRNADSSTLALFEEVGIRHNEFINELTDVYHEQAVLVAPIFKGYGLINKVVEAMAAGTLVVGDASAFNGMPFFVNGMHGLIASEPGEFIKQLLYALDHPKDADRIRAHARREIADRFSWKTLASTVIDATYNQDESHSLGKPAS